IRPFVVGRKNWLFCDSVKGAESSAIVYSIVETAKANNLEPYDYLLMVLSLLPGEGKSPSHETLERLMPWHPNA
ncbi:transposase domain-containing protein, partial [Pseudoflavonifractor phocaeensis]|uniref:transposase domain-containing protein n=1 Tax=Pseudoflavonifractor phocaeensis TaxID=1870988 RepID=UPI001956C2A1